MSARGTLTALLLAGLVSGCATTDRIARGVPFWQRDELPDAERVNVWPLFYRSGDLTTVLWPLFDVDGEGFALRPLVARDGEAWSVLYPLAGWDRSKGDWWFLPAYSVGRNLGLAPLLNFGAWNHVGPVWWLHGPAGRLRAWGLFPLFAKGPDIHHVGPVWWVPGKDDDSGAWGLFPVAAFGQEGGYLLPAWWRHSGGELKRLGLFPLFAYQNERGRKRLVTPLGGRGWGGGDEFVNVLGPLFHHSADDDERYTAVAWPLFTLRRADDATDLRLFPLLRFRAHEDGNTFSMLAGLAERAREGEHEKTRLAPLFTLNDGMPYSLWDELTLLHRRETRDGGHFLHVGTPLVFRYEHKDERTHWNALLGALSYEAEGDEARFSALFSLYRSKRKGEQTRRDIFPFLTWDSGPERSGFSFLWRLLRYENRAGRRRGHFLFIPWGDHSEPEAAVIGALGGGRLPLHWRVAARRPEVAWSAPDGRSKVARAADSSGIP